MGHGPWLAGEMAPITLPRCSFGSNPQQSVRWIWELRRCNTAKDIMQVVPRVTNPGMPSMRTLVAGRANTHSVAEVAAAVAREWSAGSESSSASASSGCEVNGAPQPTDQQWHNHEASRRARQARDEKRQQRRRSAFRKAALTGTISEFEALLKTLVTVPGSVPDGGPVEHELAGVASPSTLHLSDRFDVQSFLDVPHSNGDTVLIEAVKKGRVEVVQALLRSGASPSQMGAGMMTPLHVAAGLSGSFGDAANVLTETLLSSLRSQQASHCRKCDVGMTACGCPFCLILDTVAAFKAARLPE